MDAPLKTWGVHSESKTTFHHGERASKHYPIYSDGSAESYHLVCMKSES